MEQTGNCPIGDIKRFYVETVIKVKCPRCGHEMGYDLSSCYLFYPEQGKPQTICFNCDNCESLGKEVYSYEMEITLEKCEATLSFDPEKLKGI